MTVGEVRDIIEQWAPREVAWEQDNTGLQVGDPDASVRAVLVALDITEAVVAEARKKRANLIVSHHPLLFRPLRAVTMKEARGRIIRALAKWDINAYAAHTNMDFSRGGTSFALGQALGLERIEFLQTPYRVEKKIVTFVPAESVEKVAEAMAGAGAGMIGNYDHGSFRMQGTGTFRGNEASRPAVGRKGRVEHVPELRLEMIAPVWKVDSVLRAMKAAHPYEEPACDVYPVENTSSEHGQGILGEMKRPVRLRAFLSVVKRGLGNSALRWAGDPDRRIRRVAACGGSGGELIDEAIRKGADVFVTADVKYHSFLEAGRRIALIDAGHYETERPVVDAVAVRLTREFHRRGERVPVRASAIVTNPIHFW